MRRNCPAPQSRAEAREAAQRTETRPRKNQPAVRSTTWDGQHSNIVHYAPQPWMSSNVTITVEARVYCNGLVGNQALVARHQATNLYFGLSSNRLRFYRSGGTFADSDGRQRYFRLRP